MAKAKAQTPGIALKNLMDDYQLNPSKLSKELGLSQTALRSITIGKGGITIPMAFRLAKYFGNTPEYWITLQIQYDIAQVSKDPELTAALKQIQKAKKPAKPAAPKKAVKIKAPGKAKPPRKPRTTKKA
ncbi:hypothetical protein AGMMS50268_34510 [Spirochaetia bacterium]|nr:hypothetical protein AGMMS50268_34510 [Spirochaetia bacterium]